MKRTLLIAVVSFLTACGGSNARADATISANGITIRSCDYDAGAICSLTWNGKEFIDDYDHGRQLQSSVTYDYQGEAFNPTEAGAWVYVDGINPHPSSSVMQSRQAIGGTLMTRTQMAFWQPVGGQALSGYMHSKRVDIGYGALPNVIRYEVTYGTPWNASHIYAQFEILTGYMPREFSSFYKLQGGQAVPLSDGPGEQLYPVILSTPNGSHAMGIYSPYAGQPGWEDQGHGRWRFGDCVKWNAVYRVKNPPLNYAPKFTVYVAVGTLTDVTAAIKTLSAQ